MDKKLAITTQTTDLVVFGYSLVDFFILYKLYIQYQDLFDLSTLEGC